MFNPLGGGDDLGLLLSPAWFGAGWKTVLPQQLMGAFVASLPADGAALLFAADTDQLWLQPVCASPGLPQRVEEIQQTLGEGPASRAYHDGRPVAVPHLCSWDERWPAFTDEVSTEEPCGMFAFPLDVGNLRIGVLDLYRSIPGPISVADFAAATRLSASLAHNLLDLDGPPAERRSVEPWFDEDGLIAALSHATELVAVQLGVGAEEASARLRARAYASSRPLSEVVGDIRSGRLRLEL